MNPRLLLGILLTTAALASCLGRKEPSTDGGQGPDGARGGDVMSRVDLNVDTAVELGRTFDAARGDLDGATGTGDVSSTGGQNTAGAVGGGGATGIGGTATVGGTAATSGNVANGGSTGLVGGAATGGSVLGGGATVSGGTTTAGGTTGAAGATGGAAGSSGRSSSGGVAASGGTLASSSSASSGGMVGSGGSSASGSTSCQPKPRDCTSSLDNDCNGTPDNQENAYCACKAGTSQECGTHPGDGYGKCKHGDQTCSVSADKTTSKWGDCIGSVGPSPRDCTSSADNDCNGTADNQETTYCSCPAGTSQDCDKHPNLDGHGICKPGRQSCSLSADKTTSSWGACTPGIGPTTEVCDLAGLDENCDGQNNEGCECAGTVANCECGGTTTCTNGKRGTCAVNKKTMYRDVDGDTYGDPNTPSVVCSDALGFVGNASDCDDGTSQVLNSYSTCTNSSTRRQCADGVWVSETCRDGCTNYNGQCRLGTIGVAGLVTCWSHSRASAECSTSVGCSGGSCGTASSPGSIRCDGPNDCPGQTCCRSSGPGGETTTCVEAGSCSDSGIICDPLAVSPCTSGYHCPAEGIQMVNCQPN